MVARAGAHNGKTLKTPLTPLEPMLRGLALHAARPAVQEGRQVLSYADLAGRSAQFATLLLGLGLRPGGHVVLISPNTSDALLTFHAVPLAGGVIVPLNPAFGDEALRFLLAHADPQVVLVDRAHLRRVQATLDDLRLPVVVTGAGADLAARLRLLEPHPLEVPAGLDEDSAISVNYTSGTTSDPKGVMLTHRGTLLNLSSLLYHLDLRPGCRYLHATPLAHGNGWGMAWAVTAAGGVHHMLPDAGGLRAALLGGGVTHVCASPAWLAPLLGGAALRLPRPVKLLVAGVRPHSPLLSTLQDQGFEVLHSYGLTETSALLTLNGPERAEGEPLTRQGHAMTFSGQLQVVLEDGSPVPHDGQTPGEVVIRSNQVMKGYYKNPRATRRAIKDGWLHTGDLAVVQPGGSLDILDREGDLLNLAGQPYSSAQIEAVLYRHPSVREAVVVAAPGEGGDSPCAFVTLHPGAGVEPREILSFCAPHLPPFALPGQLLLVPDLPKTASGKVLRHVLRQQARSRKTPRG